MKIKYCENNFIRWHHIYDSRDGQFTAPVDGLYIIYAKICSQQSFSVHIEIVRNGEQLAAIYGDDYDLGRKIMYFRQRDSYTHR
jgi:hypothetical protein